MIPFVDEAKSSASVNSKAIKYLTNTLFTESNLNQPIGNESSICTCSQSYVVIEKEAGAEGEEAFTITSGGSYPSTVGFFYNTGSASYPTPPPVPWGYEATSVNNYPYMHCITSIPWSSIKMLVKVNLVDIGTGSTSQVDLNELSGTFDLGSKRVKNATFSMYLNGKAIGSKVSFYQKKTPTLGEKKYLAYSTGSVNNAGLFTGSTSVFFGTTDTISLKKANGGAIEFAGTSDASKVKVENLSSSSYLYTAYYDSTMGLGMYNIILKEALKYGLIVATTSTEATSTTIGDNAFVSKYKGDGTVNNNSWYKGSEITTAAKTGELPQMNWSDGDDVFTYNGFTGNEEGGSDDIDPNEYTDTVDLNTPSLTTTGVFNRCFAMNSTNVNSLADYIWNADESIFNEIVDGLKMLGGNPLDSLIDLRLYPFNILNHAASGAATDIVLGRTKTDVKGVKLTSATNCIIDLGSCSFYKYFKNFLDYEPYTTAELYIPFCGTVPIPSAEFMGNTIKVKLIVDFNTGSCVGVVYNNNIPVIYKSGVIGIEIPMTGTNSAAYASNVVNAALNATTSLIGGAASIASSNPVAIAAAATNVVGSGVSLSQSINDTQIQSVGASSPSCSLWQPMNCYFTIHRSITNVPSTYGHDIGYACEMTGTINDFSGLTVFSNYDLSNCTATEAEKQELLSLLKAGVYC